MIKHLAGEFYFKAWFDEETGKVEISKYGLRVIRKGYAFFTLVESFTWGKRSKKHGDFGWLPRIPRWAVDKERVDSKSIQHYAKSKREAVKSAIAQERSSREYFKKLPETVADCDRAIVALQTRLKRIPADQA